MIHDYENIEFLLAYVDGTKYKEITTKNCIEPLQVYLGHEEHAAQNECSNNATLGLTEAEMLAIQDFRTEIQCVGSLSSKLINNV